MKIFEHGGPQIVIKKKRNFQSGNQGRHPISTRVSNTKMLYNESETGCGGNVHSCIILEGECKPTYNQVETRSVTSRWFHQNKVYLIAREMRVTSIRVVIQAQQNKFWHLHRWKQKRQCSAGVG